MDNFENFRFRFAKTMCQMIDFGMCRERSPRSLRISSTLLMSSVYTCLNEVKEEIRIAKLLPLSKIDKGMANDVTTYDRFKNTIGGISVALASFIKLPTAKGAITSETAATFIVNLMKSLEEIANISESIRLKQNDQLYYLFEDPEYKKITEEMLVNLESSGVVGLLEEAKEIDVNGKKKDIRGAAKNIENSMRELSRQIDDAEKQTRLKKRQSAIPLIDPNEKREIVVAA